MPTAAPVPTPTSAVPVAHRQGMAARSAFRLVEPVSTQAPRMGYDPVSSRPGRSMTAQDGTLPTTGFDLEALATVAMGLVMAGGGSLLASRRLRKRQHHG
ncbi:MAG TPA: LPXTG cell wall anchor domain-containing protein [Trebonia sp.]|nr:LPXTG cell wall anchor domain-containing protein [Trebonia sp.]